MDDWITTAEAVTLTGYHPKHLRRLLRLGVIKGKKWSRDWQVSRTSLIAYIRKMDQLGAKRGPKPEA